MKTLYLVLMGVIITGCGKASITFTTPGGTTTTVSVDTSGANPIQTAMADITSCPAGMTLYPTIAGQGAFCMDTVANGSKISHIQAVENCVSVGKELCSMPELQRACSAGNTPVGVQYWSRTMSGANNYTAAMALDPSNCLSPNYPIDLATAWTNQYYCCAQ